MEGKWIDKKSGRALFDWNSGGWVIFPHATPKAWGGVNILQKKGVGGLLAVLHQIWWYFTGICHGTFEIVPQEVLWSIRGSHQTLWSLPLPNVTWHSGTWPYTMTPSIDQTLHQFAKLLQNWTLIPILTADLGMGIRLRESAECNSRNFTRISSMTIQSFVESHCAIEESDIDFSEYAEKGFPCAGALMGTIKPYNKPIAWKTRP